MEAAIFQRDESVSIAGVDKALSSGTLDEVFVGFCPETTAHLDPQMPDDLQILRRVLGQQLMLEVLRVDPDAAPPEAPFRNTDLNIVPDLPEDARLAEAQIKEAMNVGAWLDDYVRWAGTAANETPLNFHIGAGLYLAEIARLNVPCGITIPWLAADALWAVKVRRAYGEPKYVQIAGGSSHGLYNADRLHAN